MRHLYLSPPKPRAFAHRGWHIGDLDGLENSLAAFRRACQEGYTHVETDVHATSDDVVVVHHDPTLDRTTDRGGEIGKLRWSEVRRARIGGREAVSRIEDVLEELPEGRFNIDVKSDAAVEPMVRAIQRVGAFDRVALASFSARRLARIRRLGGPKLAMAMGPVSAGVVWANSRVPFVSLKALTRGMMAQVPRRYWGLAVVGAAFVQAAHRIGAEVHVWTVDEAAEMRALLDMGVDGIVTDRPDTLRDVLRERGVWPGGLSAGPSPSTQPSTS